MKKIIVFLFSIIASTLGFAEDANYLVLQLKNGNIEEYCLSKKPIVSFVDNSLRITVEEKVEMEILRSEVEKFYFSYTPCDITPTNNQHVAFYYLDGKNVRITGLKNNTPISVFSLDGKIISTKKSNTSGEITVYLGDLPKGVYIISYGERSIKINM